MAPKVMEKQLKAEAVKKFPGNRERQDRYVYGSDVMQKHMKRHHKKGKK